VFVKYTASTGVMVLASIVCVGGNTQVEWVVLVFGAGVVLSFLFGIVVLWLL
jgi:hypothetical protein